jgi:hypothetical protein
VVISGSICGRERASIDISDCPPISRCYASAASTAVKILTLRLPELPINWRIILSQLINGAEFKLTIVNGFRVTWLAQLDRARLAKEQAEEYGFEVNFTSNTRLNVDTMHTRGRRHISGLLLPILMSRLSPSLCCRRVNLPRHRRGPHHPSTDLNHLRVSH